MRRAASLALAAAVLTAAPAGARAEPEPLEYDLRVDGAIALGTWAVYGGTELAKGRLAPAACRWCEPGSVDAWTRGALVWSDVAPAQRTSDVLAFAVIPAGMVAHQVLAARSAGDTKAGWVDALLVAEAAGVAMDLNQLVKFTVGRQRPFVHYRNFADPGRPADPDDNLSFFSGHTTFTFAVAGAAGTISSLRGYRSTPWVWGIGLTLASATAYFRIAGDKHYLTDVLVGAATGLAAGIAIPRVFHPRKESSGGSSLALTPLPLGISGAF